MAHYIALNGPSPTTAAQAKVTTGTAIKTLLQIATPSTRGLKVVEWGITFDGSTAATPIQCELLQTDVAATVTAHVAAGCPNYDQADGLTTQMTLGTSATGYTATAEGTITATRVFDAPLVAPSGGYCKQFPLGERPRVGVSKFLRVRVTAAAAVNAVCWVVWDEE
jgi:hypothetical protein